MTDTTPSEPAKPARKAKGWKANPKTAAQTKAYRDGQARLGSAIRDNIISLAQKRKPGRPSAYRPDHCHIVMECAEQGYSLTATAKVIGVDPGTLIQWTDRYPEFGRTVARARALRLHVYETQLIDIARNGGDSSRLGAVKFAMTNVSPEDWKERFESTSNVNVSLSSLITDAMKTIEHEATSPKRLAKPDEDE